MLSVRRAGVEPAHPGGGCFTGSWARQCPADACCSSSTGGSRTHRRSRRFELRRFTGLVGQESNRQSPKASGLQPLRPANAQPTHVDSSDASESRTHKGSRRFELHRFTGLRTAPFLRASPMGFEPGHRRGAVVLLRDRQASTPLLHEDVIGCYEWLRWESNPQHPWF